MEEKFLKPDYKYWAKAESWSLKESSFLLHDVEPLHYRSLRLGDREIPQEFTEIQKTYLLLRSVSWEKRFGAKNGLLPAAVIQEAIKKELKIPPKLQKYVIERHQRLIEVAAKEEKNNSSIGEKTDKQDQSLSTRERRTFLKAIGILINLYLDKTNRSDKKISASQIAQIMLGKAEVIGLNVDGLKSMDRKITEALELIAEESSVTSASQ